jgi:hypothetical protein
MKGTRFLVTARGFVGIDNGPETGVKAEIKGKQSVEEM